MPRPRTALPSSLPQVVPRWSAASAEPELDRSTRRARGVYYTPDEIVRYIVKQTLGPLLEADQQQSRPTAVRVIDPACGAGAFLLGAYEQLLRARERSAGRTLAADEREALVRGSIFGIEIDSAAVATARQRLAVATLGQDAPDDQVARLAAQLEATIRCADALQDKVLSLAEPFDAVVGNPPYVNIRQLAKQHSAEYLARLRKRFRTARGNFDAYVLFVERSLDLLRAGGRWGLIVPNKIGGLDYARACRELLREETTLDWLADLSHCRVFHAAGVYPWILVGSKQTAPPRHSVAIRRIHASSDLERDAPADRILQQQLDPRGFSLTRPQRGATAPVTVPLGEVATLQCGTTGYRAQQIAAALQEAADPNGADSDAERSVDFIVSGNIDPYAVRLGNVRYMQRRFNRPRLPLSSPALSARQRDLFAGPKLVISGMSKQIEAAYDRRGLGLGVQVYSLTAPEEEMLYLLALLNSRYLGAWFREQFSAKQLGGGYLAINKGQLARLPIRVVGARDTSTSQRKADLIERAARLESWHAELLATTNLFTKQQLEQQIAAGREAIDVLVAELYCASRTNIPAHDLPIEMPRAA